MDKPIKQQIIISGVGGQGVLFLTHLLADAAVHRELPVFTSENHGMAQRGGTVLSHIKVGRFFSPLIMPSHADGLLALKEENLEQHRYYLGPSGWTVVNARRRPEGEGKIHWVDAEDLARESGDPKSANLIILGFTVARVQSEAGGVQGFFCSSDDIGAVLRQRLAGRDALLDAALKAFELGVRYGKERTGG